METHTHTIHKTITTGSKDEPKIFGEGIVADITTRK